MGLPVFYPEVQGPGRLTEIASFKKSAISPQEFRDIYGSIMKIVKQFPIAKQNIMGEQKEDPDIAVLIADWTSAADKDDFEPGEEYQSVKPAFGKLVDAANPSFACHHIILPGHSKTPRCNFYTISHMKIQPSKQQEAALAFREYASSSEAASNLVFLAVAGSREDSETVVCLTGHDSAESAAKLNHGERHAKLKSRLDELTLSGSKYGATVCVM